MFELPELHSVFRTKADERRAPHAEPGSEAPRRDSRQYDQTAGALLCARRRKHRLRFVVCETVAIACLVASVLAGVSGRFATEALTPLFRVLPIAAAAVATILPIVFFGSVRAKRRRNRLIASGSPLHSHL